VTIRSLRSRPAYLWESILAHAFAAKRIENQSSGSAATSSANCSAQLSSITEECSHAPCLMRQSCAVDAPASTNGLDYRRSLSLYYWRSDFPVLGRQIC
jgi:hypothetical protein